MTKTDGLQLRAPRAETAREPALDGIRGIAILLVLIGHLVPYASSFSKPGVTVFFGLSGYLITRLLITEHRERGKIDLRVFYIRRFFRLAPALIVVLLVTVLWCITWSVHTKTLLPDALSVLLYVSNFPIADLEFTPPLLHMWSLSVEEQFYFLWPLLLVLLSGGGSQFCRRGQRIVFVGVAGVISWSISVGLAVQGSQQITYRSDTAALLLLIGCMGALLEAEGRMGWTKRFHILPLLVAVMAVPAAGIVIEVPTPWIDSIFEPLVAMGAVIAAIGARDNRFLRCRLLVWSGLLSYSLYLWQTPVALNGVFEAPTPIKPFEVFIIVPLAYLNWRFVETPMRRCGRILATRLPPREKASSPAPR